MKAMAFKDYLHNNLNKPSIALAVAALLLFAGLWTTWLTVDTLWLSQSTAVSGDFRPVNSVNVAQLPALHLMGAHSNSMQDLPLASLGVTLLGIFSNNQGQSTALIAMNGGDSEMYHVGDKLSVNVSIDKILPKSVIVKHNGRLEKLELAIQPMKFDNNLPQKSLFNS